MENGNPGKTYYEGLPSMLKCRCRFSTGFEAFSLGKGICATALKIL